MNLDALLRAAQILRAQPAWTMPLTELHARLSTELGPAAGSYAQIHHRLKHRPQSFVLFDSPQLLDGATCWPAEVRSDYDSALQRAGLGSAVQVALIESSQVGEGALGLAGSTVSELWRCGQHDRTLRESLTQAARQLEAISSLLQAAAPAEHPTTPAPGLPPGP